MKQTIVSIALASAVFLSVPLGVSAQTPTEIDVTTTTPQELQNRAQSLRDARSNAVRDRLSDAQAQRITARCQNAQIPLENVITRAQNLSQNRRGVYDQWRENIRSLVARLQNNDVDTIQLEADLATLDALVEQARTDLEAYEQALRTATSLECETDPQGFSDALADARDARAVVSADFDAIREFVRTTIKADLEAIKVQLQASNVTEETNDGGQ